MKQLQEFLDLKKSYDKSSNATIIQYIISLNNLKSAIKEKELQKQITIEIERTQIEDIIT